MTKPTIFVVDLPEFSPVVAAAKTAGCTVSGPFKGYWKLVGEREIRFERKALGLGPALWNTALAGGTRGRLAQFDANTFSLVGE
jgi:hypothetical protein